MKIREFIKTNGGAFITLLRQAVAFFAQRDNVLVKSGKRTFPLLKSRTIFRSALRQSERSQQEFAVFLFFIK